MLKIEPNKNNLGALLPALLISFLLIFYLFNNYLWFRLDNTPAYNDQAHRLHTANYFVYLLRGFTAGENPLLYIYPQESYPPFFYFCGAIFRLLFGASLFSYTLVNLFFYAVLLVSVYAIGKRLFDYRVGLLSCLVLSFYPAIYGATRIFLVELSIAALSALAACLMLYSRLFTVNRTSFLLGIVCFAGMLTKQSFIFYIIFPLALHVFFSLKHSAGARKNIFIIFSWMAAALLFYAFFLYDNTALLFRVHMRDAVLYNPPGFLKNNLFYAGLLPGQITMPYCLLFIASFALYLCCRQENKTFVLSWLVSPYLILLCLPLRIERYGLPILFVVAVISSWGMLQIKNKIIRRAMILFVLAFGVLFHYSLLFKTNIDFKILNKAVRLTPPYGIRAYGEYMNMPQKSNLSALQLGIFESIKNNMPISAGRVQIGITEVSLTNDFFCPWYVPGQKVVTDNFYLLNEWGMRYFVIKEQLPYEIIPLRIYTRYKSLKSSLPYFLLTAIPLVDIYPGIDGEYVLLKEVIFQDESKVYIYRKNREPPRLYPQWVNEPNAPFLSQAQDALVAMRYDGCIKEIREALLRGPALDERQKALCYIGLASCYVKKAVNTTIFKYHFLLRSRLYFYAAQEILKKEDALNISVCSGLGFIYMKLKNNKKAGVYLHKGLSYPIDSHSKEYSDIYTNLGELYMAEGKLDEAIGYFEFALKTPFLDYADVFNICRAASLANWRLGRTPRF
ncbi:MAG: glycosyltransferase family 39 protein [Candidatus Omnitrophota bacterium]